MFRFRRCLFGLGLWAGMIVFLPVPAHAQQSVSVDDFVMSETMVPARDGVRLHTIVVRPKKQSEPLPFIMLRTPYGIERWRGMLTWEYLQDMVLEGYIFVFQDVRGRFKSEGKFTMMGGPRDPRDPTAVDESTDAYDTIDWLVKKVPDNNGRVGMLGISYDGWLTVMAMLEPHPALKAASPQASPADQFLGDDFHHNGAFRLSYGFEYVALMETSKVNELFKFNTKDTYDWYLRLGALSNANERYFHGKMPTWNDFVAHPNYDAFWQRLAFAPYLNRVTVPTLHVAGWWDQEDFYGELKAYELLEKHDKKNQNFLVVGPWNHGGWSSGPGSSLADVHFGSDTGQYYRQKIQAPWFAYHLKDKGKLNEPEALVFETGSNRWRSFERWPPQDQTIERKLYFRSDKRLSFDPPTDATEMNADSYVSDPAKPVPYRPRPIGPTYPGAGWPEWQARDQRFVEKRPDVLSYQTEPLPEDITIAGDLVAHLFAATTGTDADWIVKLIDVFPANETDNGTSPGYELMVAGEVLRGRFRKSFVEPEAVLAGEIVEYKVGLRWREHCFKKGHRIMVQVQSTWFPVIDRNPQKYVANIYKASDADYQKATHSIYRAAAHASHIVLPVLGKLTSERTDAR